MISSDVINALKIKYEALKSELDERARGLWAATEAVSLGNGGIRAVSKATGIAESTIRIGRCEIKLQKSDSKEMEIRRVRRKGGGRKPLQECSRMSQEWGQVCS